MEGNTQFPVTTNIVDTEDERVKYINYSLLNGEDDGESVSIYTISSDQTELKELISFNTKFGTDSPFIYKIKFNTDHTHMTIYVSYGSGQDSKYKYEVPLNGDPTSEISIEDEDFN